MAIGGVFIWVAIANSMVMKCHQKKLKWFTYWATDQHEHHGISEMKRSHLVIIT
jgi:hypothetical protein